MRHFRFFINVPVYIEAESEVSAMATLAGRVTDIADKCSVIFLTSSEIIDGSSYEVKAAYPLDAIKILDQTTNRRKSS